MLTPALFLYLFVHLGVIPQILNPLYSQTGTKGLIRVTSLRKLCAKLSNGKAQAQTMDQTVPDINKNTKLCSKVLCLYTCKRYDKIVALSSLYLCGQNDVISLRHELRQECLVTGGFDFLRAAQLCFKFVERNNVGSVLILEDNSSFVLPLLVEKFGKTAFRGPSFESMFLTVNKFYTRRLLDPEPVPCCHIDLNNHLSTVDLENMVSEVGLPAILKPAAGGGSMLVQNIYCLDDLVEAIKYSRMQYNSLMGNLTPLLRKYLDATKYPLALTDGMILEKYVDGEVFDLEGYVFNGKVYHWALYDMTTWPCNASVTQMLLLPCMRAAHVQDKLWNMFDTVVNRLIKYGFDNQFMDLQLFLCKNGDVRLLEINGRMCTVCSPNCSATFTSGDTIEAQLRLARGEKPPTPRFTGVHSAYVSIRSTISGKADDIINFKAAETMKYVNLHVNREDYIQPVGDGGKSCGGAYLFADSREEILQKHNKLYKTLFKKHPIGC